MIKQSDLTTAGLRALNLSAQEAQVYIELLKKPITHSQLSYITNINRTTTYRLVDSLEKRGLVTRLSDDQGKFLTAADPATLEIAVVEQESKAKKQRDVLNALLPRLENIRKGYEADFTILTYEGTEGFKRMLWHELKAKADCICFGLGVLGELVQDKRWAERAREKTVTAGYKIREMANPGQVPGNFTNNQAFLSNNYELRHIPRSVMDIRHLTVIYNDTVAIYNVYDGKRVGLEIISKTYANTQRQIANHYWSLATPIDTNSLINDRFLG